MTTLTVFPAMADDPIPGKSGQLFAVQIGNWNPQGKRVHDPENLSAQLAYIDSIAFTNAHAAVRQTASYVTGLAVTPAMQTWGNYNCPGDIGASAWEGRLRSECVWFQFWAELPTAADQERYGSFLANYVSEQRRRGRFHWLARTRLRDVRAWLAYQPVVTSGVRILLLVSFSFLCVCLLNAMGLMLAKIMARSADIGVRRALGANRQAIVSQCLMEAAIVGLAGGLVGLGFTELGLLGLRGLLTEDVGKLTHLSASDLSIAIVLSVLATVFAGLYPTWRATRVQPAWQLKAR